MIGRPGCGVDNGGPLLAGCRPRMLSLTLTLAELNALVGGESLTPAPATRAITGVASLTDAGPGDVSFFGNPKYLPALRRSRAGAVLTPPDFQPPADWAGARPAFVRVANPSLAFAALVEHFHPAPAPARPGVAATAIIGPGVTLGAGVSVGAYAVIEDGARLGAGVSVGAHGFIGAGSVIGEGSRLHPRVTIREGTLIGRRVIIQSGAVIGADGFGFEWDEGRHVKIPQVGIVQIDDDVEIGANATVDRARFGRTHIMEGTKIDNLVMIAHNVVIGPHCLIVAQTGIAGSTRLGRNVVLAGQVGVTGHVEIGDGVLVLSKSGVTKSLRAGEVILGQYGEPVKDAREGIVRARRLPQLAQRVKRLEAELAALKAAAAPG